MIPRTATLELQESLRNQAAVALVGPRQVGKTTLALSVGAQFDAVYLDLEDADDRAKLAAPVLFFGSVEDRLVILDEIHRMPDLFQVLRGVIDEGRRNNRGTGRMLILGSASVDLLRQSSESLAGRIAYVELAPFTAIEIADDRRARETLWLRGGFPDSFLGPNDRQSLKWRRDFIRTYLERDVPMFGPRIPAQTLERLWTMLAHRQGTLLNACELGKSLQISAQTTTRYIDLLVDLLLVRHLQPHHGNLGKRLVKSPKIFVRDSGLVHALLGIENLQALAGHPVAGLSWEGYVIETLLSLLPWRSQAFLYRTAAGAEINLLLEHADGTLWAVEIKRGLAPRAERGFYEALRDLKPARAWMVHAGEDRYPMGEGIEAIGLRALAEELRSRAG